MPLYTPTLWLQCDKKGNVDVAYRQLCGSFSDSSMWNHASPKVGSGLSGIWIEEISEQSQVVCMKAYDNCGSLLTCCVVSNIVITVVANLFAKSVK